MSGFNSIDELPPHLKQYNPELFENQPGTAVPTQPDKNPLNILQGTQAQAGGARGEELARSLLENLGVKLVADIATPIAIVAKHPTDQGYVRIAYREKVAGDINGTMGDGSGRRVLAEVKAYKAEKLGFHKLTPGQRERLQENHELGAVSLVIWIAPHGNYVLKWPIPGWENRKPLSKEIAEDNLWTG